jgi:hypothetical protein
MGDLFCIIDPIEGKMGLLCEKNVRKHMGLSINTVVEIKPCSHVHRINMLNILYMLGIQSFCVGHN